MLSPTRKGRLASPDERIGSAAAPPRADVNVWVRQLSLVVFDLG